MKNSPSKYSKSSEKKSLKEWLAIIESFHPEEIELGLDRIRTVANRLELLSIDPKVILVGGTNGKGSCVATLESLSVLSNTKVGCFTSPHLLHFNERIRINQKNVADEILVEAFEIIDDAREQTILTFFEFTTLAALLIFKQSNLDLVVLEVGLGGRLDAVNIVEPNLSIVTTIDKDHQAWLGDDLDGIAFEKSGIFRQSAINLVGDRTSFECILNVRKDLLGNLFLIDDKNDVIKNAQDFNAILANEKYNPLCLLKQNVKLALLGFYHLFEAPLAKISLESILQKIQLNGRFQKLSEDPLIILDVGHNPQAAKNLRRQIDGINSDGKRYAICGLMRDKAIEDFLSLLDPVIDQWIFVDLPIGRAATSVDLKQTYSLISSANDALACRSVAQAFQQIESSLQSEDQVFVFGSFITVAEMLQYWQENC